VSFGREGMDLKAQPPGGTFGGPRGPGDFPLPGKANPIGGKKLGHQMGGKTPWKPTQTARRWERKENPLKGR